MTVINKSVFCRNLDGARLLGHPVYCEVSKNKFPVRKRLDRLQKTSKSSQPPQKMNYTVRCAAA